MSLACRIIGVDNSRTYQYTEKKRFWLHDGHLPMPDNDLSVHAHDDVRRRSCPIAKESPYPAPCSIIFALIHSVTRLCRLGFEDERTVYHFFLIPTTIVMSLTLCTHICYYNLDTHVPSDSLWSTSSISSLFSSSSSFAFRLRMSSVSGAQTPSSSLKVYGLYDRHGSPMILASGIRR